MARSSWERSQRGLGCDNCGRGGAESWYDGDSGQHEADMCLECIENPEAGRVAGMVARALMIEYCDVCEYSSYEKIGGAWQDVTRADDGAAMSCGDISLLASGVSPDAASYLIPRLLSGSDYSGSALEASNQRVFLEEFGDVPGVHRVYGGHGTYGVAIRLDALTPDMCERLESITDYPVIDEDDMSRLESEATDSAWKNWGEYDFRREVRERWGCAIEWADGQWVLVNGKWLVARQLSSLAAVVDTEPGATSWALGPLRECFEQFREAANCYWEAEGGGGPDGMICDLGRVVARGGVGLVVALARIGAVVEWDWPAAVAGAGVAAELWAAAVAGDDAATGAFGDLLEESGVSK